MTSQEAAPTGKLKVMLGLVKFEHTVFALPFAYLGMVLAAGPPGRAGGLPTWRQFLWITVAMVAARTLAMAANRLVDREADARNPRTALRALPRGLLSSGEVLALCGASLVLFFVAAWQLNELCLKLAPLAAIFVVGYSYVKRFTWLTHFVLGVADAIAPVGAWIAVTGQFSTPALLLGFAVATWIAGFDLLYACQDVEFDRTHAVHSFPARFGIRAALDTAKAMHGLTAAALLALGWIVSLGAVYGLGWLIAVGLLIYEHRLVSPEDLSRLDVAFFNMNGYVAIVLFVFTFASLYL